MRYTGLVERLRANAYNALDNMALHNQAADAIEALTRPVGDRLPTSNAVDVGEAGNMSDKIEAASIALFDEILGNMGSYAEWGQPSYREAALRSISQALAAMETPHADG